MVDSGRVLLLALSISVALPAAEPAGMVFVPAGEFFRGRTYEWSDYEVKWYPNPAKDDRPVRRITLKAFYLDQAEVTNKRYAAFVKGAGHRAPYHWIQGKPPDDKPDHPVVNVSWDDAIAFCSWEKKRLPSEAEWERAARGLVEEKMFPWGDENPTPKLARYGAIDGPVPVCSAARNPLGFCDMAGNVWEWTADWYDRKYYEVAPETNPKGPDKGIYRVLRGGSWFDQPKLFLTNSYRSWARQKERSPTIGFRCASD